MSWQQPEAHHGASLHYLVVLQAVNLLQKMSPPEFSSILFIIAPTRLDSFLPTLQLHCLAIPSVYPPIACMLEAKNSIFILWRINLLLSSKKLPSVPHLLLRCFSSFLHCLTVACWGRLLGEVGRVCCGCSSSPCLGHPCSPISSAHVCFFSSSGSFPSSSHLNSSDVILV